MQSSNSKKYSLNFANKPLTIEIGQFARQADVSATVQYGDTVVLATLVMSKEIRENINFLPLLVEYEERLYAAGKIKGSRFIKREGRASDEAILSARLVDRAIRPLFVNKVSPEIQVILTILSVDGENDPDIPSLIGAFTVLSLSEIPWTGPIGAVRVAKIDESFVFNPVYTEREKSVLDITIAGTPDKVVALEACAKEVDEQTVMEALQAGKQYLSEIMVLINTITKEIGYPKKNYAISADILTEKEKIKSKIYDWVKPKLQEQLFNTPHKNKVARQEILSNLKSELFEQVLQDEDQSCKDALKKYGSGIFDSIVENEVSNNILANSKRVDNRGLTDIRPLSMDVSILPRTHGSAVFSRGDTEILSVVTLGSPQEEQTLDGIEEQGKKRFMHHYNFPPYSVGEAKPLRGPGRREIGHGELAEKGLSAVLPDQKVFPYTIRVVSEVMSSNGSSSMGSACCASMALMDAGVPIKKHVAGIAMGLASGPNGEYKIITDLQDLEDGTGGMDFKIIGTRDGITSIQMDTKTTGLTDEIISQTLQQSKQARLTILERMYNIIPEPRKELSIYAPLIVTLQIHTDTIRNVIGPGGKMINEIIDKTGVKIDIENDGTVVICSNNKEMVEKAVQWVKSLTHVTEVGELLMAKITRIVDFGAFAEIGPKQEGLIHISELDTKRVAKVTDVLNIGDTVLVKVINIDDLGRINLSYKQAKPSEIKK